MSNHFSYASRYEVRDELKADRNDERYDDYLDTVRKAATRRMIEMVEYEFHPRKRDVNIHLYSDAVDNYSGLIELREPWVNIATVTDTDGSSLTIWDGTRGNYTAAEVTLTPFESGPYWALMRVSNGQSYQWGRSDVSTPIITVSGHTGYHSDYDNAWVDTTLDISAGMTASTNTLPLGLNVDLLGATNRAGIPRLSAGNLIRIDGEYMVVYEINTLSSTPTISVERGAFGTTAVEHFIGDSIELYRPDPQIVRACARLAAHLYLRRGLFNRFTVDGLTTTQIPVDIPEEVRITLNEYPRFKKWVSGI